MATQLQHWRTIPAYHSPKVPSVNKNADAPQKRKQVAQKKYFISHKKIFMQVENTKN